MDAATITFKIELKENGLVKTSIEGIGATKDDDFARDLQVMCQIYDNLLPLIFGNDFTDGVKEAIDMLMHLATKAALKGLLDTTIESKPEQSPFSILGAFVMPNLEVTDSDGNPVESPVPPEFKDFLDKLAGNKDES